MTLREVRDPANAAAFRKVNPRLGNTVSAHWARWRVRNAGPDPLTLWLDSGSRTLQELDFYYPVDGGRYEHIGTGSNARFADRPLPTPDFVFPVTLPPGEEVDLYLRARTAGSLGVSLTPRLWAPEAYRASAQRELSRWTMFLGLGLGLCVINLMLGLFNRDRNNFYYVLTVLSSLAMVTSATGGYGGGFALGWPEYPRFEQAAWLLGLLVAGIFPNLFVARLLGLTWRSSRTVRVMYVTMIVPFVNLTCHAGLALAGIEGGVGARHVTFLIGGVFWASTYFCGAWALIAGAIRRDRVAAITAIGFIPTLMLQPVGTYMHFAYGEVPWNAYMVVYFLEWLVMSAAVADRFSQLRVEKERAQAQVIVTLQRSERELEGKVAQRTAEIAELNRTLEQRVEDQVEQIGRLGRLKRFFSPQLAQLIVAEGEGALRTHRREVSVVFIDLRGFTAFTDTSPPEAVVEMLREFHATMGRIVMDHGGTLERFAGDSLMVFFNDPMPIHDHAAQAVKMALAMRSAFRSLGENWAGRGYRLGLGCGLALGEATLGEIGFEGRWDYAAIGGVTNLAARLCAEAAPGEILASQSLARRIEGAFAIGPERTLVLKGFAQASTCHPIDDLAGARA